jgi:hypothetical protein
MFHPKYFTELTETTTQLFTDQLAAQKLKLDSNCIILFGKSMGIEREDVSNEQVLLPNQTVTISDQ